MMITEIKTTKSSEKANNKTKMLTSTLTMVVRLSYLLTTYVTDAPLLNRILGTYG